MPFNLTYTVTSGEVPITVELLESGKLPNIHVSIPSQDSFNNVADGDYTLRFTDSQGCVEEEMIGYPPCFGYLYNWYTVDDSREITSSDDWVVSTSTNYNDLATYLGGTTIAGGKLKETGLIYWAPPNVGATNEVGFNGRGSGYREVAGNYMGLSVNYRAWVSNQARLYQLLRGQETLTTSTASSAYGFSIRLIKTTTTLSDGETGTYTGNDGKIYNTICIGTQEWLSENLEETEYRNGDPIPNVTDNTTWSNLTTGALCVYDNDLNNACKLPLPISYTDINYGYMYNRYVVDDSRELAAEGWHVPTINEITSVFEYYDPTPIVAGNYAAANELKVSGTAYWDSSNGTNDSGLSLRGGGERDQYIGESYGIKDYSNWWLSTTTLGNGYGDGFYMENASDITWAVGMLAVSDKSAGWYVILANDATTLTHGQNGTYTGNDGKVYRTVCVGTVELTIGAIAETLFRNNDVIPYEGASSGYYTDSEWEVLTTPARCVYNNDENNK